MVEKNITKKYLQDRCTFVGKTVLKSVDFDGLYSIVKQLAPSEQKAIFKISDRKTEPLNIDQIDALFPYLPKETQANVDFIDMSKKDKLDLIRDNKAVLTKVLEKKGFTDKIDIDSTVTNPTEEYSSALLWDLISARADIE